MKSKSDSVQAWKLGYNQGMMPSTLDFHGAKHIYKIPHTRKLHAGKHSPFMLAISVYYPISSFVLPLMHTLNNSTNLFTPIFNFSLCFKLHFNNIMLQTEASIYLFLIRTSP